MLESRPKIQEGSLDRALNLGIISIEMIKGTQKEWSETSEEYQELRCPGCQMMKVLQGGPTVLNAADR